MQKDCVWNFPSLQHRSMRAEYGASASLHNMFSIHNPDELVMGES